MVHWLRKCRRQTAKGASRTSSGLLTVSFHCPENDAESDGSSRLIRFNSCDVNGAIETDERE